MSMSVGSVGAALPVAVSGAAEGGNDVQAVAAVNMQKKSQDIQSEQVQLLIASATGVGQKIDVKA